MCGYGALETLQKIEDPVLRKGCMLENWGVIVKGFSEAHA
jgi:hypothetical protein